MIEIIEQEIKWTNKHGGESGKSEDFEVGFVAGLKQALYLLKAAEQSVHMDDAEACDCGEPFPESGYCQFCGAHQRHRQ